ncbi:YdcF family protein [Listeria grayi]|uniref:DUF218 domain-containing protein n=2 Tax=Listeria grayi TaxID=1641 RepID=D7UZX8_LISGR|nr:YdcF family protein [Listeria grayi]EFI82973.1 hypothetical protein HMPREF0556_11658 [Listeria grayi DSM 20601]
MILLIGVCVCIMIGGLLALSFRKNPTHLRNGLLFNLTAMAVLLTLLVFILQFENFRPIYILLVGVAILAVFLLLFGIYLLIIFLIWNAGIVMRRERLALSNLLTLFAGLLLIIWVIIQWINIPSFLKIPSSLQVLLLVVPTTAYYFFCVALNFTSLSVIYRYAKKPRQPDFLIVLGSGLIGGNRVPPLLAARIDKAIAFYKASVGARPQIVFSGGKGADETISEAEAMQQYAIAKGIPEQDTLVEKNSRTTYENMRFSAEIMANRKTNYEAIFFTNNYHVLRAGMFARKAGLAINGIGAKTAFYFLPNAFLREWIAILSMHKKRHAITVGSFFVGYILIAVMLKVLDI